jgi:hypothetical protein
VIREDFTDFGVAGLFQDLICFLLDRSGNAAKFVISLEREPALRFTLLVRLLKREGEQRQGVIISGICDQPLAEPGIQVEAKAICRPLDHLGEVRSWHRVESNFLVPPSRPFKQLKRIQEIRSYGGKHRD